MGYRASKDKRVQAVQQARPAERVRLDQLDSQEQLAQLGREVKPVLSVRKGLQDQLVQPDKLDQLEQRETQD